MSEKREIHLFLNTKDAIRETNYRFLWELRSPMLDSIVNYNLSLESAEFINAVYAFTNYNNTLRIEFNGIGTFDVSIPENNYTGNQLATALAANILSVTGQAITVSYDSQSDKLTFSHGVTFRFYNTTNTTIYDNLGLDTTSDAFVNFQSSWTSSYPVRLVNTNYIDLQTNVPTLNIVGNRTDNVLARIPVLGDFNAKIAYQSTNQDKGFITMGTLNRLIIQMVDDRGNPFEMPPTEPISLKFKIREV